MGKPRKKKPVKTGAKASGSVSHGKKKFVLPSIVKNLLILGGVLILLNALKEHNMGYKWVVDTQIIKSQENIEKFKELNYDQKMQAKLGFTIKYFDFVKEHTPDTAVILMPPDTVIRPPGQVHYTKTAMNGYTTNRRWVSYFLYPRKLIYQDRLDKFPDLAQSVTHVAIINTWGYQKLPYRVSQKNQYSVMPIQIPKQ